MITNISNYTVYKHTNVINGKVYVGITSKKPESRWGRQGSGYKNTCFGKAVNKYGWENFRHEIIENNLTKDDAIELEILKIKEYNSNNFKFGYNLTTGGEHTRFNKEVRDRIRYKATGRKASDETRKKLSESHKGLKLSPESIRKNIESRKGFRHSELSKKIMSEKATGRKFSNEHIRNLSESHKNKRHSEEYKLNMRINSPNAVRVMCVETGNVYYSYYHAAEDIGGSAEKISLVARGKKKDYRKLHFIIIEEEE